MARSRVAYLAGTRYCSLEGRGGAVLIARVLRFFTSRWELLSGSLKNITHGWNQEHTIISMEVQSQTHQFIPSGIAVGPRNHHWY